MSRGELVGIALGSNLGDRLATLRAAARAIAEQGLLTDLSRSGVFETAAVGERAGGMFLNAVVVGRSGRPPREILDGCMRIERSLGRDRAREGEGGPRTIDLDLLFVGSRIVDEPGLQVPHPRMFGRRFVLQPLAEVAGNEILPTRKESVHSLLASLDPTAIARRVGPL